MKARNRYANTISVTFRNTLRALRRAGDHFNHRRLGLFWTVAVLSLTIPWALKGCSLPATGSAGRVYNDCSVLSIYDGDTMTVACAGRKMKVRLYCIDAPEMDQEPWGRESRDHLRAITPPTVRVVVRDRDRYGREVAEVIVPDDSEENLNRAQVWAGQAAVYRRYCPDGNYDEAEDAARKLPAGIWREAGEQQNPSVWRNAYKKHEN